MGGPSSHQNVRIERGRHKDPSEGACVMELASMLAGEAFSDRPRCVDPILGAYLRAFNDRLGHADRQRLYPYAARAVGTRGSRALARRRRDLCLAFAGHPVRHGDPLFRLGVRLRLLLVAGFGSALVARTGIPTYAARTLVAGGEIDRGFALIDAMLDCDTRRRPAAPAAPTAPATTAPAAGLNAESSPSVEPETTPGREPEPTLTGAR